jgi:hypothetical protein
LRTLYSKLGLAARFPLDAEYLKQAFEYTERLWFQQFNRMGNVKVVMLSEAPLYGVKQTYIYNPASPPTAFLHFNDLRALLGTDCMPAHFDSAASQKSFLLDCLIDNGFLILDIFPFALNPEDTTISFRRMPPSIYNHLLVESSPFYLYPKLLLIQRKSQSVPRFVYRYKRLFERTNRFVESQLMELSLLTPGFRLESINGTNMSLDRSRLATVCSGNQFEMNPLLISQDPA